MHKFSSTVKLLRFVWKIDFVCFMDGWDISVFSNKSYSVWNCYDTLRQNEVCEHKHTGKGPISTEDELRYLGNQDIRKGIGESTGICTLIEHFRRLGKVHNSFWSQVGLSVLSRSHLELDITAIRTSPAHRPLEIRSIRFLAQEIIDITTRKVSKSKLLASFEFPSHQSLQYNTNEY